jgi:hypothetical protein
MKQTPYSVSSIIFQAMSAITPRMVRISRAFFMKSSSRGVIQD